MAIPKVGERNLLPPCCCCCCCCCCLNPSGAKAVAEAATSSATWGTGILHLSTPADWGAVNSSADAGGSRHDTSRDEDPAAPRAAALWFLTTPAALGFRRLGSYCSRPHGPVPSPQKGAPLLPSTAATRCLSSGDGSWLAPRCGAGAAAAGPRVNGPALGTVPALAAAAQASCWSSRRATPWLARDWLAPGRSAPSPAGVPSGCAPRACALVGV